MKSGQIGNEMYIIKDGVCQVLSADEKVELGELGKGDYFGDINVILGGRRMANVKALTHCAMYSIKRSFINYWILIQLNKWLIVCHRHVLEDVMSKFPEEKEKLVQRSKQRRLDLIKKNYLSFSNTTINPLQQCGDIYLEDNTHPSSFSNELK